MCWDVSEDHWKSWENKSGDLSLLASAQGSGIFIIQQKNKDILFGWIKS